MRDRPFGVRGLVAPTLLALALVSPVRGITWKLEPGQHPCERPDVFYSNMHDPTFSPCCPRPPDRCPAGVACVGGTCPAPYASLPCTPPPATDPPNIILYVADDQGYCDYGFMGPACRCESTGRARPVPATPNLDQLTLQPANGGRGRIFPLAYDGAPSSLTSRFTMQSGLMRKDNADPFVPVRLLAQRLGDPDGPLYCSFAAGGKLGRTGEAEAGFRAWTAGKVGKTGCAAAPCAPNCDAPPRCGADTPSGVNVSLADTFIFIDALLVGPRAPDGNLDPSVVYTQAQPFFMWFGSALPHPKHIPPPALEVLPHSASPTDYLFGPSFAHPGQPRFPFGDPRYVPLFAARAETDLPGAYGAIWWGDDMIHQLRQKLEGIQVRDAAGGTPHSLWERTVVIFVADNGSNLPRSKGQFTENGYRTPIVVYDARLPESPGESRVDFEVSHTIDVMPTVLDYGGHPIPPLPGQSLRPYLDGTQTTPLRNTLCAHEVRSAIVASGRFIRPRAGAVGRCRPAAGSACGADADCPGGVCLLGACASGQLCLEDDDCPGGETCGLRTQKWCRLSHDPVSEGNFASVDRQPSIPCTTEADCVAACPSADPLYCTCEYRQAKVYLRQDGTWKLMDVFVDPDEAGLQRTVKPYAPGDIPVGPTDPARHLADRLACCLDRWWVPPGLAGDPTCTGCEPTYRCDRCGDGIVDAAEQCDGTNLHGATCVSVGFTSGTLGCTASCTFDTSGCS